MRPQTNREKLLDKSKNPFGSFWELCDEITELTAGHCLLEVSTLRESFQIIYYHYKNRHLNLVSIPDIGFIVLKVDHRWAHILKAVHQ